MKKFEYKPQYGIVVLCENEKEQKSAVLYQKGGKRGNTAGRYGGHFRAVQGFAYIGGGDA